MPAGARIGLIIGFTFVLLGLVGGLVGMLVFGQEETPVVVVTEGDPESVELAVGRYGVFPPSSKVVYGQDLVVDGPDGEVPVEDRWGFFATNIWVTVDGEHHELTNEFTIDEAGTYTIELLDDDVRPPVGDVAIAPYDDGTVHDASLVLGILLVLLGVFAGVLIVGVSLLVNATRKR